jgi:hypothetical protein
MDPVKPFAGLIRTLWKSTTASTTQKDALGSAATTGADEAQSETAAALAATTLRTQIRARLTRIGLNDPRLAREVFVETVLISELGENLSRDPGLTDMVKLVAEHIAADARLGDRLHSLLRSLVEEPPPV